MVRFSHRPSLAFSSLEADSLPRSSPTRLPICSDSTSSGLDSSPTTLEMQTTSSKTTPTIHELARVLLFLSSSYALPPLLSLAYSLLSHPYVLYHFLHSALPLLVSSPSSASSRPRVE